VEKLVYVLFREPSLSEEEFRANVLGSVSKGLIESGLVVTP